MAPDTWFIHLELPRYLRAPVKEAMKADGRTLTGWLAAAIVEKLERDEPK